MKRSTGTISIRRNPICEGQRRLTFCSNFSTR